MYRTFTTLLLVAVTVSAGEARSQDARVTVRGVAYDSVRREILPGAFVTLGGIRSATADGRGRFEFEEVAPGVHLLDLQHAVLDSMGLPGVSMRITVTDGRDRITIAIPSFATLWRAACGARPPPRDSGFVYGSVRDARDGRALPDAAVELIWFDLSVTKDLAMSQRMLRAETRTDANGEFSVCGVPLDQALRIMAAGDSSISGLIDLPPRALSVQRRDLLVGHADRSDSAQLGGVAGVVVGEDGAPVQDVRVVMEDIPQMVTGTDGRFLVRGVLPGTRQVEFLAIGRIPIVAVVDVATQQTANVRAVMARLSTLAVVRVVGSNFQRRLVQEFEENRRMGFGTFLDSSHVGRRGTIESVFSEAPGVWVQPSRFGSFSVYLPSARGGQCLATMWLDGLKSDGDILKSLRPADIAVVEVFRREFQVPARYWNPQSDCGAVSVWTKNALR